MTENGGLKRDKDSQTHTQRWDRPSGSPRIWSGSCQVAGTWPRPPPASSEQTGRAGTFCTPAPGRHSFWEQSEGVKRA